MLTYTYFGKDDFRLCEKPVPELKCDTDALVKVTLSSICTSDLHIMHGYVPRAIPGITVGHEAVGEVVAVGAKIRNVKPGDRVSVNVETFCGAGEGTSIIVLRLWAVGRSGAGLTACRRNMCGYLLPIAGLRSFPTT